MSVRFVGPLCLCKADDVVDVTSFASPFRLIMCLDCIAYRLEWHDSE